MPVNKKHIRKIDPVAVSQRAQAWGEKFGDTTARTTGAGVGAVAGVLWGIIKGTGRAGMDAYRQLVPAPAEESETLEEPVAV